MLEEVVCLMAGNYFINAMRIYYLLVCICAIKQMNMTNEQELFEYLHNELDCIPLETNLFEIIDIVNRMQQPAPLDPKTCELCVGDVVNVYWSKAESTEGIILEIDDNLNEKLRYRVFDFWYDEPSNCSRSQLTLSSNQRAAIKILKLC